MTEYLINSVPGKCDRCAAIEGVSVKEFCKKILKNYEVEL